jgi:hypothetical protein
MNAIERAILLAAITAVVALCVGCRPDRPPSHRSVECAFFYCAKCDSLDGGIYGKGPVKSLRSATAERCRHEWGRLSREQFKELSKDNFGIDWSKESPWWSSQGPFSAE